MFNFGILSYKDLNNKLQIKYNVLFFLRFR